jgi:hypothetical protein
VSLALYFTSSTLLTYQSSQQCRGGTLHYTTLHYTTLHYTADLGTSPDSTIGTIVDDTVVLATDPDPAIGSHKPQTTNQPPCYSALA